MTAKLKGSTQVMIRIDDKLLAWIDEQPQAQRHGRSAFIKECIWAEHDRLKAATTVPESLADVFKS